MEIDVFIVGCERSGTTWMSNIFDANDYVEIFLEPYSNRLGKEFTGLRTKKLSVAEYIKMKEVLSQRYFAKYPFLYKPGRPINLKKLEHRLFFLLGNNLIPQKVKSKINNYHELNFNSLYSKFVLKRKRQITLRVLKELRLNKNTDFIKTQFEDASIIIMIRHPLTQISSIYTLINQGSLNELALELDFFKRVHQNDDRYGALITEIEDNIKDKLMQNIFSYWVINYSSLFKNLSESNLRYKTVYYEDLCKNPHMTTKNLFKWLGINLQENCEEYIDFSSSKTEVVSTKWQKFITEKNSFEYLKESKKNINQELLSFLSGGNTMGRINELIPGIRKNYFISEIDSF